MVPLNIGWQHPVTELPTHLFIEAICRGPILREPWKTSLQF